MNEINKQEVIIAPGVAESIVGLSVEQVDGVARIGTKTSSGGSLLKAFSKKPAASRKVPNQGILILEEDGKITVDIQVRLFYGYKLQEVAAQIREAVSDALLTQACIEVDRVDITIIGIVFRA